MEKGKDMMNEQREGSALFSIAIMVLTAVVWMSLDIYLPALPVLQEEFSVSASYQMCIRDRDGRCHRRRLVQ